MKWVNCECGEVRHRANVLNGAVLAACKPRHRHQEFLSFLRQIDNAVPAELDIHCIVDNYATYSHPKIKAWLAALARPRAPGP
jgi:putative transposase